MKRTQRGEQILNRLVNDSRCELTEQGKNWLIQVLDPNHDRPFVKTGWPSQNNRPSIIRQVKQSISISATSGGGAPVTAPFDVHVAWVPVINAGNYVVTTARTNNNGKYSSAVAGATLGGLMCRAQFATGTAVNWTPSAGAPEYLGGLSIDPTFLTGECRLVGVGFEVMDTSAEINKQGSLCVYSYPQSAETENGIWVDTNAGAGIYSQMTGSFKRIALPPTTLAAAMLLPDSKLWEGKYGVYCVPSFQDFNNPANDPAAIGAIFEPYSSSAIIPSYGPTSYIPFSTSSQDQVVGAISFKNTVVPLTKIVPTNTCGCVISGCNPNSTYTISLTYYLENVPRGNDNALVVLTQPAAPYDPFALMLYSRITERLPPGVFQGENSNGKWFWDIVADICDVAVPFLEAIPQTAFIAKPAKQAGEAARNNANRYGQEKEKKKKKAPGVPQGALVNSVPLANTQKPRKPLPPVPQKKKGG